MTKTVYHKKRDLARENAISVKKVTQMAKKVPIFCVFSSKKSQIGKNPLEKKGGMWYNKYDFGFEKTPNFSEYPCLSSEALTDGFDA